MDEIDNKDIVEKKENGWIMPIDKSAKHMMQN